MDFFGYDSALIRKVCQVNLAKREIDIDSLSLEGLEGLLDQIFGPDQEMPAGADASTLCTDGGDAANKGVTAHGDRSGICATLPDTRLGRHKRRSENGQTEQIQNLSNQVTMLRARLHYALEQLEHARLTEASLRLSLAYAQDQLKAAAPQNL